MEKPIKIAIAGSGYAKKVALPVYTELAEFEPVAMWSRRPERAKELADEAGVKLGTADFDELLSAPGLEAVHVATPVATHVRFAVAAAERGLHVICEKPLADNLEGARRIMAAIRSAGVIGLVGYGRRFQQTRRRVIELLDRDDPLEADQARVAVIGLELMLVLRGDLAGTTQRRLFVPAVDQDDAVLDHARHGWLADDVCVAQLDREPTARVRERRIFRGRRTGAAPDRHAGGGSSPITVCDCSRRNCWT